MKILENSFENSFKYKLAQHGYKFTAISAFLEYAFVFNEFSFLASNGITIFSKSFLLTMQNATVLNAVGGLIGREAIKKLLQSNVLKFVPVIGTTLTVISSVWTVFTYI